MLTKKIGNLGEKIAERYLKKKGYQILEKNYINKFVSGPQKGEIDIIVKKNDTIIFVEVKSLIIKNEGGRASGIFPEERVDFLKQRKIMTRSEIPPSTSAPSGRGSGGPYRAPPPPSQ